MDRKSLKVIMFTLLHHPFCPHSRFIRLGLGEHGLELRPVEERIWERREAFLAMNPAGTTPVLIAEGDRLMLLAVHVASAMQGGHTAGLAAILPAELP